MRLEAISSKIAAFLIRIILEPAVERGEDVQDIDVSGEDEKFVITLLVMRYFSDLSGALRACADFRVSIADSRINYRDRFL